MRKLLRLHADHLHSIFFVVAPIAFFASAIDSMSLYSHAQTTGGPGIPEDRQIYNTFDGNKDKGTIFEATNPMDLLQPPKREQPNQDKLGRVTSQC